MIINTDYRHMKAKSLTLCKPNRTQKLSFWCIFVSMPICDRSKYYSCYSNEEIYFENVASNGTDTSEKFCQKYTESRAFFPTHYNLVFLLEFRAIYCGHKSWISKCFDFIRQGVNFHRVPDGADKGQPKLVFVFWSEKVSKSP